MQQLRPCWPLVGLLLAVLSAPASAAPPPVRQLAPPPEWLPHYDLDIRLDIQGHWFWRRNPFFGMFPFDYAASRSGTVILHVGADRPAHLLVPRTS